MMLIPYRAKNPPERYPYVTIALMSANILIFALTSHYFLSIRDSVVQDYALSRNTFSALRLFTSIFLHADLLHLAGNMLFLWIFGSAAEGRLGHLKFSGLYLVCGFAGSLLHDGISGVMNPDSFGLGASGAIMGLAGAYIFMFPFATICVVFQYWFRVLFMEWQAQWVVLYFIAFDILNGLLYKGADGVAHLAHLGGFGAGFLGAMVLKARRDSEYYSEAQAVRADSQGDFHLLGLHELAALMETPTTQAPLVLAYCQKLLKRMEGPAYGQCLQTVREYSRLLAEEADSAMLAQTILLIPLEEGALPSAFYLRLASRLEKDGHPALAARAYRRVYDLDPKSSDSEIAMLRWGNMLERTESDRRQAASIFSEMLRQFPNGTMAVQARAGLTRCGGESGLAFSAGSSNAAVSAPAPGMIDSDVAPVSRASRMKQKEAPKDAPSTTADDLAPMQPARTQGPRPAPAQSPPPDDTWGDDLIPVGGNRDFS